MRELKEFMYVKNVECARSLYQEQPQILYLHESDHFKGQSVIVESEKSRGKVLEGDLRWNPTFSLYLPCDKLLDFWYPWCFHPLNGNTLSWRLTIQTKWENVC